MTRHFFIPRPGGDVLDSHFYKNLDQKISKKFFYDLCLFLRGINIEIKIFARIGLGTKLQPFQKHKKFWWSLELSEMSGGQTEHGFE